MSILELKDLTVAYGAITVVRGVSLNVSEGEIVCVVGPIGAGKTTVLSSVMGLCPPASGSVMFRDQEMTGKPTEAIVAGGLSLVPERRRLFGSMTVRDNLILGAGREPSLASDEQTWERLFERFPILKTRIDGLAGYLSGGEAQQLAIARALVGRPQMLLLDEPSLGLAPKVSASVLELLSELRDEEKLSVLLIEQNAFQALGIADRGYVLAQGEIADSGTADELLARREVIEEYLGVRPPTAAANV